MSLARLQRLHPLWERLTSHSWASTSTALSQGLGASSGFATTTADEAAEAGAEPPGAAPKLDLLEKFLDPSNMSRKERSQLQKQDIIADFQRFEGDVGSSEVQVALLTARIRDLAAHCQQHKQDKHSRKGLQGLANQRRKLLSYLRRSNFERYCFTLHKLGLKDNYAKQSRYDNFKVGTRLGMPAQPRERYLGRK